MCRSTLFRWSRPFLLLLLLISATMMPIIVGAVGARPADYDPDDWLLQAVTMIANDHTDINDVPIRLATETYWYTDLRSVAVDVGKNAVLPNPDSFYAVTGIGIVERSNNPCHVTLWGMLIDPRFRSNNERKLAEYKFDACLKVKATDTSLVPEQVNLSTYNDFKLATWSDTDDLFVRGLRTCTRWTQKLPIYIGTREMKGVRLLATRVDGDGTLSDRAGLREAIQPNCPDREFADKGANIEGWEPLKLCPAEQLLVGVTIYRNDESIEAMEPRCKNVGSRRIESPPRKDLRGY